MKLVWQMKILLLLDEKYIKAHSTKLSFCRNFKFFMLKKKYFPKNI